METSDQNVFHGSRLGSTTSLEGNRTSQYKTMAALERGYHPPTEPESLLVESGLAT